MRASGEVYEFARTSCAALGRSFGCSPHSEYPPTEQQNGCSCSADSRHWSDVWLLQAGSRTAAGRCALACSTDDDELLPMDPVSEELSSSGLPGRATASVMGTGTYGACRLRVFPDPTAV